MLELVAIWIIVVATIIWFVRDERRIRLDRLQAQARLYATAPQWRHRDPPPPVPAMMRVDHASQSALVRRFAEELQRLRVRSA